MSNDNTDIKDLIAKSTQTAQSMTVGGESHTNRTIDDLIKADEHLGKAKAAADPFACIKTKKVIGNGIR